ncbi:MAG: Cof-type HAD-IIB family hydrolase [Tenericutes bacterium]|nr:Cof-type HAD-IIB family hydrolase [Mycoplasmatota bacterium]
MALIFFDLDGTTLDSGTPALGVIEGIKALKANNHTVAIATGRTPIVLSGKDKLLGIENLVLANGAYVIYKDKVVYERSIPSELVKRVMDFSDKIGADLIVEYLDSYTAYRKETDIPDEFSEVFKLHIPKLDRNFYEDRKVFAMVAFELEKVQEYRDAFPELTFNISNHMGFDINLKGDSKAEGIKKLIKHLGYQDNEVYAIGDGNNDITMLKAVKYGIAMGNASDEVKAAAKYVTTNVDDYGVYNALKHYNLI